MKDIKTFIEKAIEGGYSWKQFNVSGWSELLKTPFLQAVLLDPLAWQAVGKSEGWSECLVGCFIGGKSKDFCGGNHTPRWKDKFYNMPIQLAEGKTIEEYIKTL